MLGDVSDAQAINECRLENVPFVVRADRQQLFNLVIAVELIRHFGCRVHLLINRNVQRRLVPSPEVHKAMVDAHTDERPELKAARRVESIEGFPRRQAGFLNQLVSVAAVTTRIAQGPRPNVGQQIEEESFFLVVGHSCFKTRRRGWAHGDGLR